LGSSSHYIALMEFLACSWSPYFHQFSERKICHTAFFTRTFLKLSVKLRMVLNYTINMLSRILKNVPQAKTFPDGDICIIYIYTIYIYYT